MIAAFLVSLGASCLLAPLLCAAFRRLGLVHAPNHRSSHATPTVVAVGAVVPGVAGLVCWSFTARLSAGLACALGLAVLGFVDDALDLPPACRFGLQLVLAGLASALVTEFAPTLTIVGTLLVTAAINGLNFMDGINGITGMSGVILGGVVALAAWHAGDRYWTIVGLSVAGACLGYLPNNFPIARSFPGDVLPYFLGAVTTLGVLTLAHESRVYVLALAALIPAGLDTSTTIARRIRRGHSPLEAHREHAYQRLSRRYSHAHSSVTFLVLQALCAAALPLALSLGPNVGVIWALMAGIISLAVLLMVPTDA